MMNENKKLFVSALESALIMYSREKIAKLEYVPHNEAWSGLDTVDIRFANGHRKVINVTGDSCIAIMQDIARALI